MENERQTAAQFFGENMNPDIPLPPEPSVAQPSTSTANIEVQLQGVTNIAGLNPISPNQEFSVENVGERVNLERPQSNMLPPAKAAKKKKKKRHHSGQSSDSSSSSSISTRSHARSDPAVLQQLKEIAVLLKNNQPIATPPPVPIPIPVPSPPAIIQPVAAMSIDNAQLPVNQTVDVNQLVRTIMGNLPAQQIAREEMTKTIKGMKPRMYEGKKSNFTFEEWADNCLQYGLSRGLTRDSCVESCARCFLAGEAKDWYESSITIFNSSWEEFTKRGNIYFTLPESERANRFLNIKQKEDESIFDYTSRANSLFIHQSSIPNTTIATERWIQGMLPHFEAQVRMARLYKMPFKEAFLYLQDNRDSFALSSKVSVETKEKEKPTEVKSYNRYDRTKRARFNMQTIDEEKSENESDDDKICLTFDDKNPDALVEHPETGLLMPMKVAPNTINESRKNISCYYCHKQGHIRRDCPRRLERVKQFQNFSTSTTSQDDKLAENSNLKISEDKQVSPDIIQLITQTCDAAVSKACDNIVTKTLQAQSELCTICKGNHKVSNCNELKNLLRGLSDTPNSATEDQ